MANKKHLKNNYKKLYLSWLGAGKTKLRDIKQDTG